MNKILIIMFIVCVLQLSASDSTQELAEQLLRTQTSFERVSSSGSEYDAESEFEVTTGRVVASESLETIPAMVVLSLYSRRDQIVTRTQNGFVYAMQLGRTSVQEQGQTVDRIYTYFGPEDGNGTYVFETGLIMQREHNGLKRILYQNGNIYEHYPDGSKKSFFPDGSRIEVDKYDNVYRIEPDGSMRIITSQPVRS